MQTVQDKNQDREKVLSRIPGLVVELSKLTENEQMLITGVVQGLAYAREIQNKKIVN